MNVYKFNHVLYKGNINIDFYLYSLKKNKSLIKYLFVNVFLFILSIFFVNNNIYEKYRFKYLGKINNLNSELNFFFKNNNRVLKNNYKDMDIIVDKVPIIFMKKIFDKEKIYGYELNDSYEVNVDKYNDKVNDLKRCNNLYINNIFSLFKIKSENRINVKFIKENMFFNNKFINVFIAFWLSIILTCMSFLYINVVLDTKMILSYFSPLLFILNMIPIFILLLLFLAVFKRLSVSWLITSSMIIILGIANQTLLTYRDEVVKFGDLFLAKEAAIMANRYDIIIKWYSIVVIVCCILIFFLLRKYINKIELSFFKRLLLLLAIILSSFLLYDDVYQNESLYDKLGDKSLVDIWIFTRQSQIRGLTYPFVFSIKESIVTSPEGYDSKVVKNILKKYSYKDIDSDKKVNIIAIMLESYNDLSKFDIIKFNKDVYDKLHKIQKESISGSIVTNVFGGGTIVTERNFLTGYDVLYSFRKRTNSYVWYFKEQGYVVDALHPITGAFYSRSNVNPNLGFDMYYNYDNTFRYFKEDYKNDEYFMNYIIKKYEDNKKNNKPYFSFSVTYQNHGPYTEEKYLNKNYYFDNDGKYDESTYNIINEYLNNIYFTNKALSDLIDYFDNEEKPTIVIIFGDHNPYIGDDGFSKMGVNMDLDNVQGFLNYYETPYVIHANNGAKKVFNKSFVGIGNVISPIFIMNELFDYVGIEGNEYLQYMSNLKKKIDVIGKNYYKEDGVFVNIDDSKYEEIVSEYRDVNYYMANNFNVRMLGE